MPRFLICLSLLICCLAFNVAAVYAAETAATDATAPPAIDISVGTNVGAGLPTVTSEEFTGKITRIVGAIYQDVVKIAAPITILVCAVGALFGIFLREARHIVLWGLAGFIFILWIPQILGLFIHYFSM